MSSIYKEVSGKGQDVVVIHGACASHLDMAPIVKALEPHYKVTCVDTPGTGKSPWNDNIKDIHDFADCLLEALPEKAIYIGWSLGGITAQSIAARYPSRVKHLIGLMTSPKIMAADHWHGLPPGSLNALVLPFLEEGKGSKDLLKMRYEEEFSGFNPKPPAYYEAEKNWNLPSMLDQKGVVNVIDLCEKTDLRDLFKTIHTPMDFIMGEQDPIIPSEVCTDIQRLNPNTRIHMIEGGAHVPFWTHPTEFNAILHHVMKRI